MTQPCKICRGTGTVECPSQLCAHWCSCTVCNGTGEVEVYEDWSQGFAEEKVRKPATKYVVQVHDEEGRWWDISSFPSAELAEEYRSKRKAESPNRRFVIVARVVENKEKAE